MRCQCPVGPIGNIVFQKICDPFELSSRRPNFAGCILSNGWMYKNKSPSESRGGIRSHYAREVTLILNSNTHVRARNDNMEFGTLLLSASQHCRSSSCNAARHACFNRSNARFSRKHLLSTAEAKRWAKESQFCVKCRISFPL